MGWTFDTNLTGPARWKTLTAAVIVLAATVLLLWFGSLPSVDAASADGNRSVTECPQSTYEECEELASQLRPIVEPNFGSADPTYGEQEAVRSGPWAISPFGNPEALDSVLSTQYCVPLKLCRNNGEHDYLGEEAAVSLGQGFGEQEAVRSGFLSIPVTPIFTMANTGQSAEDLRIAGFQTY